MLQRLVWGVGAVEIGGFSVLGVDTEDGEVARVAGPHPVVRVAAELANVRGRGADEAHIGEYFIDVHEVLVAVVEGFHDGLVVGARDGLVGDGLDILGHDALAVLLCGLVGDAFQHLGGNVLHADQAGYGEARAGDFLAAGHGPEAVGEVIVLDGAVLHDVAVAAVVVGEQQALVADELACAASAEEDDGVFERGVVDVVDVAGRDAHTGALHGGFVALEEHGNPHAFVGAQG